MSTRVSYAWKEPHTGRKYRTGVSLHSHTSHSRETLAFVNYLAECLPLLGRFIRWQQGRAERAGFKIEWSQGYWTPPLTPPLALELERRQIEDELQSHALVSLTDHDSIAAPHQLNMMHEVGAVPVSVEWTVPFAGIAYHLGIHNLPLVTAPVIMDQLASYTAGPSPELLNDLLSMLNAMPEVLVVFNHPFWNLYHARAGAFAAMVEDFLRLHGAFIHALELNGLRAWQENCAVSRLAASWRKPLVSGGDRHGCEPNAVLNLTNAGDFTEFVREIRADVGNVLFMPQYRQGKTARQFRTFVDIIRKGADLPAGMQRWDQRVFHPGKDGRDCSLAKLWNHPPAFLDKGFAAVCWMESAAATRKILSIPGRWERLKLLES